MLRTDSISCVAHPIRDWDVLPTSNSVHAFSPRRSFEWADKFIEKKAELAAQRTQTYQCIHYGLGAETAEPRVGSSRIVPDEVAAGDCLFAGIAAPVG